MHAARDRPPERHPVCRSAAIAGGSPHGRARRGGTGFRLAQRALFLGTPEFAVRSLEALDRLRESGIIQIAGVVTQPDRPASRGVLREPAVKVAARAMGLALRQPARLDEKEVAAILALDRKSTRLNSSHLVISYAVFCLKKKKNRIQQTNVLEAMFIGSPGCAPTGTTWRSRMDTMCASLVRPDLQVVCSAQS